MAATAAAGGSLEEEGRKKLDLPKFIQQIVASSGNRGGPKYDNREIQLLLAKAKSIFREQGTLVRPLNEAWPLVLCGDVYGNLSNLLQLFVIGGPPPSCRWLMLGNYVDRGANSVECLLLLLALKCLHPEHVYMLRGNHEDKAVCSLFRFKVDFIERRHLPAFLFERVAEIFEWMPLAALVAGQQIFCCHGGLSIAMFRRRSYDEQEETNKAPKQRILDRIRNIRRPCRVMFTVEEEEEKEEEEGDCSTPESSGTWVEGEEEKGAKGRRLTKEEKRRLRRCDDDQLVRDLLWACPMAEAGFRSYKDGMTRLFGADVVERFRRDTGVQLCVRGYQIAGGGFHFFPNEKVLTLFSALNVKPGSRVDEEQEAEEEDDDEDEEEEHGLENSASIVVIDQKLKATIKQLRPRELEPPSVADLLKSESISVRSLPLKRDSPKNVFDGDMVGSSIRTVDFEVAATPEDVKKTQQTTKTQTTQEASSGKIAKKSTSGTKGKTSTTQRTSGTKAKTSTTQDTLPETKLWPEKKSKKKRKR